MSIAQALMDHWNGVKPTVPAKEIIRESLEHGVWVVEFTKVDGTPATMEATLDPALLPPLKESKGDPRPEQDHLLHVYSIDRAGWRSFVVANVRNFYRKPV